MSDIFISYARQDRPRAKALAKAQGDHGWPVGWDWNIPAGEGVSAGHPGASR
ncbi:MAG: hypothetical protein ABSB67_22580 [Bryobacteraceae bacterium]|jgi:hypothetical protein